MGRTKHLFSVAVLSLLLARTGDAQWQDPKLIAGQVGFSIAVSFVGKMVVGRLSPGTALKQALREGAAAGLVAHAGYSVAATHPDWALVGKTFAQKSVVMTRRSMRAQPVFDSSFLTHWELTHSFLHFKWDGAPHASLDVINLAFSSYYAFAPDHYDFDARRTLLSGSLVFLNRKATPGLRGLYVPGAIWVDAFDNDIRNVLSHEIVHSFQAERGASIKEWHHGALRFNWLVVASGVPALLSGWPEHDDRWHEYEADGYADAR